MLLKPGDKIKFRNEKQAYTVRACNSRFVICTKPFNPRRTVIYTIVDLVEKVRGPENLIFCMGFESDQDCRDALARLTDKNEVERTEVSHRHRVPLDIEEIRHYARR